MSRHKTRLPGRIAVFLLLVICAAAAVNAWLCARMLPSGDLLKAVRNTEGEAYRTLLLGTHLMQADTDESVLLRMPEAAVTAAAPNLHMREQYYLLRDACRKHELSQVVLEYDPSRWTGNATDDPVARALLRHMSWSGVKASYAKELFAGRHLRYLLFPWLWYTGSADPDVARPAVPIYSLADDAGYLAEQAWFEKLASYCHDRQIRLTVVTLPVSRTVMLANTDFFYEADVRMHSLAEQYGFTFLDYILSASSKASLDETLFDETGECLQAEAASQFTTLLTEDLIRAEEQDFEGFKALGSIPDLSPEEKGTWKVTQFGEARAKQEMCYALTGEEGLVLIDGGWAYEKERLLKIIAAYDHHVAAWILTHPHNDHMTAFMELYRENALASDEERFTIDHIYTTELPSRDILEKNAAWDDYSLLASLREEAPSQLTYLHTGDELEVIGLTMQVFSAYDDGIDDISNDLLNDGSLVFKLSGKEQSILFCADAGSANGNKKLSKRIRKTYGDELKCDYMQISHHGFGGLSNKFNETADADTVFFDAPDWLLEAESGISSAKNLRRMQEQGRTTLTFLTAPNQVVLR